MQSKTINDLAFHYLFKDTGIKKAGYTCHDLYGVVIAST